MVTEPPAYLLLRLAALLGRGGTKSSLTLLLLALKSLAVRLLLSVLLLLLGLLACGGSFALLLDDA
jgi:hypothetical protein